MGSAGTKEEGVHGRQGMAPRYLGGQVTHGFLFFSQQHSVSPGSNWGVVHLRLDSNGGFLFPRSEEHPQSAETWQ